VPTKDGAGFRSRAGRWHPRSWWFGHHDTRDACGEYTPDANLAGPCSPRHNTGRAGWGSQRYLPKRRGKATSEREQHREALRLGQHAQDLRAEEHSRGYRRELNAFYGRGDEAPADHTERRIRTSSADRDLARHNAAGRHAQRKHA